MMLPEGMAVAFPGQGITSAALAEGLAAVGEQPLVTALAEMLGTDDWAGLDVNDTRVSQPAVYTAGLATARARLDPEDVIAVIGHSLGELTALAFAGAVHDELGLTLARRRGELCHEVQQGGRGAMAAIMGLDLTDVEHVRRQVVSESEGGLLDVAAINSERQIVLSGDRGSVDAAIAMATRLGAVASLLPIGGAFHSPMMGGAARQFRRLLEAAEVGKPRCTFVSTVRVRPLAEPDDLRDALGHALLLPVRWIDGIDLLVGLGVETVWEPGPGATLMKLARRIGVLPFVSL